jgi:hypothetical protein
LVPRDVLGVVIIFNRVFILFSFFPGLSQTGFSPALIIFELLSQKPFMLFTLFKNFADMDFFVFGGLL